MYIFNISKYIHLVIDIYIYYPFSDKSHPDSPDEGKAEPTECVTVETGASVIKEEGEYIGFVNDWISTFQFIEGNSFSHYSAAQY